MASQMAKNLINLNEALFISKSDYNKIVEKERNKIVLELFNDEIDKLSQIKDKVHILLAEDNVINEKVTTCLISQLGIPVDVTRDGQETLEALKNNKYDMKISGQSYAVYKLYK